MMDNATSLQLLDTYIRIPTISSEITPETVARVQKFWRGLGLEFELLWPATPPRNNVRNPALYTEIPADQPGAPTILLYGHWDVQPTGELSQWRWAGEVSPPFEPTYFQEELFLGRSPEEVSAKVSGEALGQVTMVARGTADNKGQHLANILGVLRAKATGQLKWNVKVILDGEEEVGSPNLGAIVEAHREKLKADFMVGSDGPKSDNRPTVLLGVRGLVAVVLRGDNGTGRMLHSGNYGNVQPNPVFPMARLLEEMKQAIAEMGQAAKAFRQEVNRHFDPGSPDYARFEPYLYPTFNVNSLMTEGATAGQRRTIIPSWVEASIDVRLIPGLAPQAVYAKLEELAEKANREAQGVKFSLEYKTGTAASFTSPEREGYAWLERGVKRFWKEDIRWIPILGGTLPNDIFTDGLGLASYWLPAANSNNRQHDTNEHFVLEHFFRQQDFYATLMATGYGE
jgi:acetylornithine deacetylase/succinyl-diaminopimelate desuccinylase-like protein